MDFGSGERENELLEAQVHVLNHTFNFINSMALKCAIELAIPDVIHSHGQQPMPLSQLVTALSVQPSKAPCLRRLMRLLVHSGFFSQQQVITHNNQEEEEEEEAYSLTAASLFLLKGEPLTGVPLSIFHLNPVMTAPWQFLSGWFQNGDPTPFYTAHGKPFWDYTAQEPDFGHLFNEAMASDSRIIASVLITKFKDLLQGLSSLVDVGAGTGTMIKAIAKAFPHLKCTVFDQPHVVADLQGGGNLEVVGGDMFEAIPPGNAVILKWILHNWSDEECVKILKKCKEAIPSKDKGGKLIIIDMVMEQNKGDAEAVETQLFWDMLMMTVLTGKQRNENEWKKLFETAGLTEYKIRPVLGFRSFIEVYP